jgi:hypothetical protein
VSERIATSVPQSSRSWVGSTIVILGTVSLLLTLNEGYPSGSQRVIDSLFHNWLITGSAAIVIWLARRETFGALPSPLRGLSTLVATYFAMVSSVAILVSPMFWDLLKPFGVVQKTVQPAAVLGLVWLWGICLFGLFIRGIIRWFRGRYEHHGVAVGVGPVYFYFRRRRAS